MRWIYTAIVAIFCLAMVVFALQNLEIVTMSFLGIRVRLPLALLAVAIYIAGAITGGGLFALIRQSLERSRSARSGVPE